MRLTLFVSLKASCTKQPNRSELKLCQCAVYFRCVVCGVLSKRTGSSIQSFLSLCARRYTPFTLSSKHRANMKQMYSKYTCTTCALIVRCLLDVCLMFAWSCKRGISFTVTLTCVLELLVSARVAPWQCFQPDTPVKKRMFRELEIQPSPFVNRIPKNRFC